MRSRIDSWGGEWWVGRWGERAVGGAWISSGIFGKGMSR